MPFFRRRLDLPLDRDRSARSLAWIIAVMVYLAGLALAVTTALGGTVERWTSGLAGTMTAQLPPDSASRLPDLLTALRGIPGVKSAQALDAAATSSLLEPWLGPGVAMGDLKLPVLIDLRVDPARLDEAALRRAVTEGAPGATLDDHHRWLDRLVGAVTAMRIAGAVIIALVAVAAVTTIVFATRAGLAAHHGVVEVLHLIGAHDRYIARQFEWQALRLGFRGGLLGLALAALTIAGILYAADAAIGLRLLPEFEPPRAWLFLLALPVVVALVAMATARLTVMRVLGRMP